MEVHGLDWSFRLSPFWTKSFILLNIVVIILAFYFQARSISRQKWQCPNCNKVFTPRWVRCLASLHFGNDQLLRCPYCKKKNFCWRAEHVNKENESN